MPVFKYTVSVSMKKKNGDHGMIRKVESKFFARAFWRKVLNNNQNNVVLRSSKFLLYCLLWVCRHVRFTANERHH